MINTSTDPVRLLIRETLAARGLNMSSVSKKLDKNHAYLHQFLDRGIPARLPELVREKLAVILDVPEVQLKGDPAQIGSGTAIGSPSSRVGLVRSATDKIPVHSTGREAAGGWLAWTGEIVDYVSRPPQLAGATQPYAVYVLTSGMEPRYEVGEVIYVHPGKPVTPGAFVLVQTKPEKDGEKPRAAIRRFVRRSATKVTLEQLSPPKQIDLRASDILEMHRIVGSAESSGQ
jgi:SOS-response transcriptional repressor LexA